MEEVLKRLKAFRDARNWSQFHTPENLATSVVLEAAELLENYQFHTVSPNVENVKEELADIMGYCLLLCDHYGFDVSEIMHEKITKNEQKYPIDKVYGSATKYTKLKR